MGSPLIERSEKEGRGNHSLGSTHLVEILTLLSILGKQHHRTSERQCLGSDVNGHPKR